MYRTTIENVKKCTTYTIGWWSTRKFGHVYINTVQLVILNFRKSELAERPG